MLESPDGRTVMVYVHSRFLNTWSNRLSTGYLINMQIGREHLAQLQADNLITRTATGDSFPIATPLRPLNTNRAQFAFISLRYNQGSTNPLLCPSAMREELMMMR